LVCYDSKKEGLFLAGSLWMAQYYIRSKNMRRFFDIMDAVEDYVNDLGLTAEEALMEEGMMAGNFPQILCIPH
jgi:GH15 family glucan-1,4-alpha-glucosidase